MIGHPLHYQSRVHIPVPNWSLKATTHSCSRATLLRVQHPRVRGSCVHRHVCRWGCLQNVQPDYIARPSNLPARTGCSAHQPFASICFTIIRTTLSLVVVRHVLCAFCVAGLAVCCTRCCVVIVVGAAIMLSCCLLVLSLYAVSLMVCCPCLSLHWVICSCDP